MPSNNESEVENKDNTAPTSGRRIIYVAFFKQQIKKICNHAPQFGCTFNNMDFKCEIKRGLRSGFVFQCNMCGVKDTVWST